MIDLDRYLPAIAGGDGEAFGRWLAAAEPQLRSSLRSFARRVDTEAVLQEAALRTWQVAPKVRADGRPNGLLRLALRIARNHAIDEVRRARAGEDVEIEALPEPQVSPADPLLREAIRRCREHLAGPPARALTARLEARGCRHDRELAEALDMRLNTFLKNLGRARALLIACLRRSGIEMEGAWTS